MTAEQVWLAHNHGGLVHRHHHRPDEPHDHTVRVPSRIGGAFCSFCPEEGWLRKLPASGLPCCDHCWERESRKRR